jgi:hypothetical protein
VSHRGTHLRVVKSHREKPRLNRTDWLTMLILGVAGMVVGAFWMAVILLVVTG